MERVSKLAPLIGFLIFFGVLICLYGAFQQLIVDGHWIAFLVGVAAAGGMVAVFLKLALIPDRRYTTWVRRAIGSINAKYFFGLLLIAWIVGMSLLGLQAGGMTHTQIGGLALIGLFAGVFVFMGFIWAVIGD
jgi:hypothetical protein